MNWSLTRINWHSQGRCWSWFRISRDVYYSGNMMHFQWGRIALIFERKTWNTATHKEGV